MADVCATTDEMNCYDRRSDLQNQNIYSLNSLLVWGPLWNEKVVF